MKRLSYLIVILFISSFLLFGCQLNQSNIDYSIDLSNIRYDINILTMNDNTTIQLSHYLNMKEQLNVDEISLQTCDLKIIENDETIKNINETPSLQLINSQVTIDKHNVLKKLYLEKSTIQQWNYLKQLEILIIDSFSRQLLDSFPSLQLTVLKFTVVHLTIS